MKEEIIYKASDEVKKHINGWLTWLKTERMYSLHTIDAYARDLSSFFKFWHDYLNKKADLSDLQEIDIRTFRSFLSHQKYRHLTKTTLSVNSS